MALQLDICLTPGEYSDKFSGHAAAVIDVFRATSSMAAAFANKCQEILPVETVAAAVQLRELNPSALLAGERHALKIEGFNLGNSPREFTCEAVGGKTVIMTTTNGTVALVKAAKSPVVYTAAFVNANAVERKLRQLGKDIVLVCAGRERAFSLEDALCAGLLAERLADIAELSDAAQFARSAYQQNKAYLLECINQSRHARYLAEVGLGEDVAWCLQHDIFDVVPRYKDGVIKVFEE